MYSRGTGGKWADRKFRTEWVKRAEGRFPSLTDRITTIAIPGGVEGGSFRNPETAHLFKDLVEELVRSKAALDMYDPDQQVNLASLGRLLCGESGPLSGSRAACWNVCFVLGTDIWGIMWPASAL
jgi:hypothetical protein